MNILFFGDSHLAQLCCHQLAGHEVANYAVGGLCTRDGRPRAPFLQVDPDDVVVLSFGSNDAAPWKQVPLDEFVDNYRAILGALPASRVLLVTPPVVDSQRQQPPGRSNAELGRYAQAVRGLPASAVVDLFAITAGAAEPLHLEDGVHLNSAGEALFLAALEESTELLGERRARQHP